jgi:methionyl-tRNA formyltransferase
LRDGSITPQRQDDADATLAPILTRDDGRLRLEEQTAQVVYNRWRGFRPWPGSWTFFRSKRFIINVMKMVDEVKDLFPGELAMVDGQLCTGAAHGTAIALQEVQMEGKPKMDGAVFARDFQLKAGERLG